MHIGEKINKSLVTNIIVIGDSMNEIKAGEAFR